MQVYRYFDIGTAKPSTKDRQSIPHHLIDIINPDEEYSAGKFKKDVTKIINKLHSKGKIPIIAGGTGLHINALTKGMSMAIASSPELRKKLRQRSLGEGLQPMYMELLKVDPIAAKKINPADSYRIQRALEVYYLTGKPISSFQTKEYDDTRKYDIFYLVLNLPRPLLYQRINERVDEIMNKGLVEEVKTITARGYSDQLKPFQSIGYKQIIHYLKQKLTLPEAVDSIKKETRHFAKRQLTWYKKAHSARWFEMNLENQESTDDEIYKAVQERFFTQDKTLDQKNP